MTNIMKPTRIQRKRTKGWKMPENTIYVGRPSKYGNPFTLMENGVIYYFEGKFVIKQYSMTANHSVKDIVNLYERWITGKLKDNRLLDPPTIEGLKGKNLSCFCTPDNPCHADVLLKLANDL